MKTSRFHPTIVKLVATGAMLLFLLTLSALPAFARAGTITEFPLPKANSGPQNIVSGPDGNLWFTEANANKMGRISPSGRIAEFVVPSPKSGPFGITPGPDGKMWFTEYGLTEKTGDKVGRATAE